MLFTDRTTQPEVVRARREVGFEVIHKAKQIGTPAGFFRITTPRHKRLDPFALQPFIHHTGLTEQQFKEFLR